MFVKGAPESCRGVQSRHGDPVVLATRAECSLDQRMSTSSAQSSIFH